MQNTYLPKSSLLAKAVTHNDKNLLYQMAEQATGDGAPVAWHIVPMETMPDADEAPSAQ